jgi:hypothetical protein
MADAPNYTWDHIHLRTPDPEAMAAWFERMLGAQVIRTMQQGKPRIAAPISSSCRSRPTTRSIRRP